MDGRRSFHSLRLKNFLSYGDEGITIPLEPLNVLIGPNAVGKSNLIEAFGFLQAIPKDITSLIREGGGIDEWLWDGGPASPTAEVEAILDYPDGPMPLRYRIAFGSVGQRFEVRDEAIENSESIDPYTRPYFFYHFQDGRPALNYRTAIEERAGTDRGRSPRKLRREDLKLDQSVLSQRRDADQLPELTWVTDLFSRIRLYREWNFGRYTAPRLAQRPDLIGDFLEEDASNLALVLNDLQSAPGPWNQIQTLLSDLYEPAQRIITKLHGGTVQVFIAERGVRHPLPATRLSDGTLRFLCLLAILCHPTPPPLICIEEPELGLHPDMIRTVARLLVDASQRTQLIVTTHSDHLVSALADVPEAVVVCEKEDGATRLRRLDANRLEKWLEDYKLGELWLSGEIGGNRW